MRGTIDTQSGGDCGETVAPTVEKEIFFTASRRYRRNASGALGMDEVFYLNDDFSETAKEYILHCFAFGVSRWGSEWSIQKEYSDYISFNFFLEGGVIIKTREETYSVNAGDLLIARRSPLVMATPRGGMARKYCLLLSNTVIQSAICDLLENGDPCVLRMTEPEKISDCMEKILEQVKTGTSRRILDSLIFDFLQEVRDQNRFRAPSPMLLDTALDILRKNDFKLSRVQLARQCHVSSRTLTRIFDRHLHAPPGQYIVRCRMEKAVRMLSFSQEPIKKIADECGFSSPMFFARVFRQHYGCAPSEFRKRKQ